MSDIRARILGAALAAFAGVGGASLAFAQTQSAHHTGVDASIRPGENFYLYANNTWIRATPLPAGVTRLDTTSMLRTENAGRVRDLIEGAARSPNSTVARMVGDYYESWLDAAAIEARCLAPLSDELAEIATIADRRALAAYLGRTLRLDDGANRQTESLWGMWIHQGFHDPNRYAAHFVQGGLGLAQADDYLNPEPAARRELYRAHIANVLRIAGFDRAAMRAGRVLELEIAIAATHASRTDTDDVYKTDNTWRRDDFVSNAPGIDWGAYFSAAGLGPETTFVVWQPQSVIGGSRLVARHSLDAWKDYLAFHFVEHYAAVLPSAISDEWIAFDARLSGGLAATAPDRRQQALAATEAALADAVGQLYVERYFSPEARAAANAMVDNIRAAFLACLSNLSWMSPETRATALAKLAALRVGLGYPESWIDYADLAIVRGDAFGNHQRAEAFANRRALAKLTQPVDSDEWAGQLHPHRVSAILNLSPNSMQFSAGILQPPYFDPNGDAATNYGSAGAGIAHEISHSFDPVGHLYDAEGRLAPWWTEEDRVRYQAALAPLAAQLDTCCPTPDACTNGAQILAESSADLAGLAVAYDAYLLSLQGRPDAVINGLTGEQRFFIAFAQRWRRQQSDASLRQQVETDNHAPPPCRSNLVRNADAWVNAFGVTPGDALHLEPAARIRIW